MRNVLSLICGVLLLVPGATRSIAAGEKIPVFGEIEFAELLQNPEERAKYEGKVIDLVGELNTLSKPTEEKPRVEMVGFGKTYQTTIYRVQCRLAKPMKTSDFERISQAGFVVLRGRCSVKAKLREVGSDVWYDFDIILTEGRVRYWGSSANPAEEEQKGEETTSKGE